jgi:hypothetical protein
MMMHSPIPSSMSAVLQPMTAQPAACSGASWTCTWSRASLSRRRSGQAGGGAWAGAQRPGLAAATRTGGGGSESGKCIAGAASASSTR